MVLTCDNRGGVVCRDESLQFIPAFSKIMKNG